MLHVIWPNKPRSIKGAISIIKFWLFYQKTSYYRVFDKYIEITNNNIDNGKILQIDITNHGNYTAKRQGLSSAKHTTLRKRELLLVPSR